MQQISFVGRFISRLLVSKTSFFKKKFPVKKIDITKLLSLKGNSMKTFKAVMAKSGEFLENVGVNKHDINYHY